ncbi:1,2-dihydroxy-3-keto-5-methylthiopentene dioxygenase [Ixodes scapularis]|uniref:1,2-dihydroxy-3-keto-5-methylthiopentene dioxygenase n=1 Tax=Ixodes scapularis TaxID=6945 RepID=UPI001A9F1EE8|nr:1,2-dihydroxy-3-keto-5-methylthiopentene dioxygenase [Ixodes scapularis]
MLAWYLDEPKKTLGVKELRSLVGVTFYRPTCKEDGEARLEAIQQKTGCDQVDTTLLHPFDSEGRALVRESSREHQHDEEEIRMIGEGGGFFDIRDLQDTWVRIQVQAGDLIVLPPRAYHRFTPKGKVAMRRIYATGVDYSAVLREA